MKRLTCIAFAIAVYVPLGHTSAIAQQPSQTPSISALTYFASPWTLNNVGLQFNGNIYINPYLATYFPDFHSVKVVIVPGSPNVQTSSPTYAGATTATALGTQDSVDPYRFHFGIGKLPLSGGLYYSPFGTSYTDYTIYYYLADSNGNVFGSQFIDCEHVQYWVGSNGIVVNDIKVGPIYYQDVPNYPPGPVHGIAQNSRSTSKAAASTRRRKP